MYIARVGAAEYFDLQNFIAKSAAVAIWTTQVHVAEKLHFHVLKTVALTGGAAAIAGVEGERARSVAPLLGQRGGDKQVADRGEGAHLSGGGGRGGVTGVALVYPRAARDRFPAVAA